MTDYAGLQTEILLPAYAAMTDTQIAAAVLAKSVTTTVNPLIVAGSQIYNLINGAEWATLTAAQQTSMRDVFGMGPGIDASAGTNVRATIVAAFTGKPITIAALTTLTTTTVSRAVQLGFPAITDQDVIAARKWIR